MGALDPTVMRWYMPQELFDEYGRRQWRYTNYATEPYRRYIDRNQEGTYFYDTYGKLISRGWLVYDWRQTQARTVESSQLTKERRYQTWFNRLIISSDASGDYNYSLMIGDEIFATLTPMTFRKVGFNGGCDELCGAACTLHWFVFTPEPAHRRDRPGYSDGLAGQLYQFDRWSSGGRFGG